MSSFPRSGCGREKSKILVTILDLTEADRQANLYLAEHFHNASIDYLRNDGPWAAIDTIEGGYAFNSRGQTNVGEIPTPHIRYYPVFEDGSTDFIFICQFPVTLQFIENTDKKGKAPLELFINTWSKEQETLYNFWAKKLAPIAIYDIEETKLIKVIDNRNDLKKYIPFIKGEVCTENCEALIEVNKGICICGVKDKHYHCKGCGKVLVTL